MYAYDYIPLRIIENCGSYGDKIAYQSKDGSITYDKLRRQAFAIAEYLKDDTLPVVIYGHKSPFFIAAILGCLLCGRTYIPCDLTYPTARIEKIAAVSGASVALHTEKDETSFINGICNVSQNELSEICMRDVEFKCAASGDIRAYIVFTSGSTGMPKGIAITRDELSNFIDYALSLPTLSLNCDWAGHALFSFDLSVADIYLPLFMGNTFHAIEPLETGDFGVLCCTPSFLRLCLCSSCFNDEMMPNLKTIICCGEVLPVKTAIRLGRRFKDVSLVNAYGPAECCCFVICHEVCKDDLENKMLPVGDLDNSSCKVEIRDGEIFISGKSVGSYVDGHAGGFRDGGYYTGDSGFIENGLLYFGGRINNSMIKYSGYRIEPEEIETEIMSVDGVEGCVCVPIYGADGEVVSLKAHVAGKRADIDKVKKIISEKLPPYMVPKLMEKCDELPMTPNGKCDRKGLENDDNR